MSDLKIRLNKANWCLPNLILAIALGIGILAIPCKALYANAQSEIEEVEFLTKPGSAVFIDGSLSGISNSDGYINVPIHQISDANAIQVRVEHRDYRTYERTISVTGATFQNPIVINLSSSKRFNNSYLRVSIFSLFGIVIVAFLFIAGKYFKNNHKMSSAETPVIPPKNKSSFTEYSILSKIAQGGVATIYEAKDKANRTIALKVMTSYLDDEDMVNKFIGEGWAMQKIKKKFPDAPVAMVYDYGRKGGDPNGVPYIAMELVEGKTLSFFIKNNVLKTAQKIEIIKQLIHALDASHQCNVLHRDLSPDNVLVKDSSEISIRLIDFGVARHEIHWLKGTSVGAAFGKPEYMAPEQIEGKEIDFKVDYYSLGILTYALFVGRAPFTGKMMYDVFEQHIKAQVPAMPNKVPKNVQRMIYALLQKDSGKRPNSAQKILEHLN